MVNLTIGGGNFKGISYVGALEYLFQNNLINSIENFYGSSVGTIIGILYLIGYKPVEIFKILLSLDLEKYWDFNFNNLQNSFSLITDSFFKKIKEIINTKVKSNITFIEFYNKYKVKLNIFATSVNQRKNICFNLYNNPNIEVFTAMQASCSIPFIFPPVKINNELYIDGCIKCIDGVCPNIINDNKINFIIKGNYNNINKKIDTLVEYINEIINCTMQNNEEVETEYTINIRSLNEYENKYNFNDIKTSDKIKLYYHGIYQAKLKFDDKISEILLKITQEILNNREKLIKEKLNKENSKENELYEEKRHENRKKNEFCKENEFNEEKSKNKSTQTDFV